MDPERPPLAGLTVLVVDDEISAPLARLIELEGARSLAVSSIATAREVLDSSEVDALVTDLLLLNGNGHDLIRELRLVRPDLPVVLISGVDVATLGRESISCVFVPKPIERADLVAAILDAIGRADTERPPR